MAQLEAFPIISRRARRKDRVQKVQHLAGAFMLIAAAVGHLGHGTLHLLPVLELIAAAALIASVIAARVRGESHRHGIAWVELAGAAMVTVEAIEKLQQPHHVSFYVLSFIPPVVLLLFAIFDAQIAGARRLTSDDDRFQIRTGLFFVKRVRWSDVEGWRMLSDGIEVKLRGGRTKILSFRDVDNRTEALEWARARFERCQPSAPRELPGGESRADQSQRNEQPVAMEK